MFRHKNKIPKSVEGFVKRIKLLQAENDNYAYELALANSRIDTLKGVISTYEKISTEQKERIADLEDALARVQKIAQDMSEDDCK